MTFNDIYEIEELKTFIEKFSSKQFYSSQLKHVMEYQDFNNIVLTNIFKKIYLYDCNKSKIKSFLGTIITTTLLEEIRRENSLKRNIKTKLNTLSIDYEYSNSDNKNSELENYIKGQSIEEQLENSQDYIIDKYTTKLKKEEDKKIIKLLYLGYNINEITEIMGFKSRSSIQQKIKRIKLQLA